MNFLVVIVSYLLGSINFAYITARIKGIDISSEGSGNPGVEKDLTLFGYNSERMDQAVELVEETIAAEKRKKERRLEEQAQRLDQIGLLRIQMLQLYLLKFQLILQLLQPYLRLQ